EKLKQVKSELKKIAEEQKVVTDAGLSFKDMLDIGGNLSMIFGSFIDLKDNIADFVRDNADSYIALDAEMANVQKFTGMAREQVELLNEELKNTDTRTSVVELNKLAEEAGRLGKTSQEDVLGFVKAADIINVALDDLGEGATLTISKLTNIFGDEKALGTERSMLAVGSVINELSQNCTAAAPYLADFTKRLAGVGAQADMTIPHIMGYAAVLDAQGQAVEMSATAVSQLITKMFQDPAKIAKATGMDVQEFTNLVKTDTNTALLTLLERLNSFGSMDVLAPMFKEMGTDGARASAVLAALAGNIDMIRQQQEIANQAYNEATSVVKEFNVQNETEEAKLEKKRKKLEEVKVALGEKLLPIMGSFTSTGTMMIKTLNALLDVFNDYKGTILATSSTLLIYIACIKLKNLWTEKEIILDKLKVFWNDKVISSLKKLNATMKANKFGIVAAVVIFLISRLHDLDRAQNKVNARMKELRKIENEAKNNYQEEVNQIVALRNVLEDSNAEIGARRTALKKLQEIVPEYHASLTNEGLLINNNTVALENYVNSLKIAAEQQLASNKLAEVQTEKR
ncbi:MAG: phage tail tape measure protein, partial [Bacteroidaceae bacterium]|nr:phage tail tape measure protein [Bacteroidaceae bacterium]